MKDRHLATSNDSKNAQPILPSLYSPQSPFRQYTVISYSLTKMDLKFHEQFLPIRSALGTSFL